MTAPSKTNGNKYLGLGLLFGTLVGVATGNIGLWMPLGLVFGVAIKRQVDKDNSAED